METLIDLFELHEPVIETYRAAYRVPFAPTPRQSIDLSVYFEDDGAPPAVPPYTTTSKACSVANKGMAHRKAAKIETLAMRDFTLSANTGRKKRS